MSRKYTDSSYVIQTTGNISAQRGRNVDQIPFSLVPFTVKSATAQNDCATPPYGDKAYIVAQSANPKDFLFEVEKMNFAYREITAATTATAADRVIGVDPSSGTVAVTLPTAASVRSGFILTIKDITGDCASNNITISRSGSDTIDGGTSVVMSIPRCSVSLISNGAALWNII